MKEKLDLLEFMPEKILCGENQNEANLNMKYDEDIIYLSYETVMSNGKSQHLQEYSLTIPRFISKNINTFEVIGLLQAEMGKTQNGCLNFCNSESKIMRKVLRWFENELQIDRKQWRWYIKINLQEPNDEEFYLQLMDGVGEYWAIQTGIDFEKRHPKGLTFVKDTKNEIAENNGTLIIEKKNNLFSQIIKNFIKKITYEKILTYDKELIRAFMRGIIAGEGCVNYHPKSRHYAVHISATKEEERIIYKKCLAELGINIKIYDGYKEMLISRKSNLIQLLEQRLTTISPNKYDKFLYMMQQYPGIEEETGYFVGKRRSVWNKYPKEKIDQIIKLYDAGVTRTKDIAQKVGVSIIKVNRVLREHNLGKRAIKYSEEKKKDVLKFIKQNPNVTNHKIALKFDMSESSIQRLRIKYNCRSKARSCFKTSQDKIDRIIEIYKANPTVKIKEICKEVGISDSVVMKVRRDFRLSHLGFGHLVGRNNKKIKNLLTSNSIQ